MTRPTDVLVVDDTSVSRQLAVATLAAEGFVVDACADGPQALARAISARPRLILLDVRMPGMDGFEVCHRLKQDPATRDIPVIFVTGADDTEAEARAFELGGSDYITKPLRAQVLMARVRAQLALRELQRSQDERFRDLIEMAPVAFLLTDAAGVVVQVNALAAQTFGCQRGELIGQRLATLVPGCAVGGAVPGAARPRAQALDCHRLDGSVFPADVSTGQLDALGERGLYVAVVQDSSERQRMLRDVETSRQMIRNLAAQSERGREEERKAMAREVHDELGQMLTAMRMELGLLRLRLGGQVDDIQARLEPLRQQVDRAIFDVRQIARNLRPMAMDAGLGSAIESLRDEFVRRTRVACDLDLGGPEPALDEARAMMLYRIVQESLNNITKYAQAGRVAIDLRPDGDQLLLRVRDDGCGFVVPDRLGQHTYGLLGMQERAIALGGRMGIVSAPGQGTQIAVSFPRPDALQGSTT